MDHVVLHISSVVHVEDVRAVCLDKSHVKCQRLGQIMIRWNEGVVDVQSPRLG